MRILSLTRYERLGSSSRVRFYQYFPYLLAHGIQIQNAALLDNEYVRRLYNQKPAAFIPIIQSYFQRITWLARSRSFDLLWIEKELLPWVLAWMEYLLSRLRVPYVVDYDDAIFHRYDAHPNWAIRALLGRKIDAVMRAATLVIVGNDYLATRAHQAGARRVEYLPSVVDASRYTHPQRPGGRFHIGWIGSPITAPFLKGIHEPLRKLSQDANTKLILIGLGEEDPLPGIPKEKVPWSEEKEASFMEYLDVGIMQLPDEPFERGKCGYKLIQYMAGGLPVIASPVGINARIVEHGRNGYLASIEEEWMEALQTLRDNPEARNQMGSAGRRKVEEEYDLRGTAPRLLDLLTSAANG